MFGDSFFSLNHASHKVRHISPGCKDPKTIKAIKDGLVMAESSPPPPAGRLLHTLRIPGDNEVMDSNWGRGRREFSEEYTTLSCFEL
jgi:hypothetical protein